MEKEKAEKSVPSKESGREPVPRLATIELPVVGKIPIKKIRDSEAGGMPSVKNEDYFHGFIPKDQSEGLLHNVGDFLVRQAVKTEVKNSSMEQFIISIRVVADSSKADGKASKENNGQAKIVNTNKTEAQMEEDKKRAAFELRHLLIKYSRRARLYYIRDFGFKLVSGLIDYHRRNKLPIDLEGTTLGKPIKRASWQLNHEQVLKTKKLGDGAFGDVFLGSLRVGLISRLDVAIKTINGTVTADENEKLFQEAMLMKSIVHPNVVQLVGVASNEEPVMIVMEFAPGGSVLDAVKKQPGPSIYNRIRYCHDASKGLEYLTGNGIIHRDIAARNALIGKKGEAKISDFGLSITGGQKKEKKLKKVPYPYLAVETLQHGVYNKMTDVWSFGVYMWEIFHDGKTPWGEDTEMRKVKQALLRGDRLLMESDHYPNGMWEITKTCWLANPEDRPTFKKLAELTKAEMEKQRSGSIFSRFGF